MDNLHQIEAAAASLSADQQRELLAWLAQRVGKQRPAGKPYSVLDISPADVGQVLSFDEANSDVLDEMLEQQN